MSIVKELLERFQAVNELSHDKLNDVYNATHNADGSLNDRGQQHLRDKTGTYRGKDGQRHRYTQNTERPESSLFQHALRAKNAIRRADVEGDKNDELPMSIKDRDFHMGSIARRLPYVGHWKPHASDGMIIGAGDSPKGIEYQHKRRAELIADTFRKEKDHADMVQKADGNDTILANLKKRAQAMHDAKAKRDNAEWAKKYPMSNKLRQQELDKDRARIASQEKQKKGKDVEKVEQPDHILDKDAVMDMKAYQDGGADADRRAMRFAKSKTAHKLLKAG